MGRYYISKKVEADNLLKVDSAFLKKHGYLQNGFRWGTITWTSNWYGKNEIGFTVNTTKEEAYCEFQYTLTSTENEVKKLIKSKFPLTYTSCYFGGKRYWFICSMYKSGNYCGRRVRILYKGGDYFACRHCYQLSYSSRNLSGLFKVVGQVISEQDLVDQRLLVKRKYYMGKMTKKYKLYLKRERKSFAQMRIIVEGLEAVKKFDK